MTEIKGPSLLVEGTKSYPEAIGALNEFTLLVVSIIRSAVVEELGCLSAAMGVELKKNELSNYVRPNRLANDNPKDAVLGVAIDRIGESRWGLYSYLNWPKGQPELWVSIWLKDNNVAQSIFTAFKKSTSPTPVELDDGHEIYISRALVPDSAEEQIPAILQDLYREFSQLWTKAGGLGRFLKP